MGLILDVDKIMYQLSRWRPIFHSEADFQFSLALLIKEQYPNYISIFLLYLRVNGFLLSLNIRQKNVLKL